MSIELITITSILATIMSPKINILSTDGSIEEVNKEIIQQDVTLEFAQQQARVAQELAIALRIETADEVEIEEFYDVSGNGNVGLKSTKEGLHLGVSGGGKKITKRIYKFKGHNGEKVDIYEQKLNEVFTNNIKSNNDSK